MRTRRFYNELSLLINIPGRLPLLIYFRKKRLPLLTNTFIKCLPLLTNVSRDAIDTEKRINQLSDTPTILPGRL